MGTLAYQKPFFQLKYKKQYIVMVRNRKGITQC